MRSLQHFKVKSNRRVASGTYLMDLEGDTANLVRPGQFVNVEVPGFYLRRPFSVCSWDPGMLTLMYKTLGEGTRAMTQIPAGQLVSVLSGLGNGFDVEKAGDHPLVVGGGIGVAPMLALTEHLVQRGKTPHVVLGFGSEGEVALEDAIAELGVPVTVTTVDGSRGVKGFVTDGMDALKEGGTQWDYLFACGPTPMLKAVFQDAAVLGQYSMEERMACGFGACMGCVIETTGGVVRICKEGPVFESGVLPW